MLARVPGSSFKKLSEYYKTALQQQTKPLHSTLLPWSPLGSPSTPALPISQGCWDHASQIKTPGNHNRIKKSWGKPASSCWGFFSMGINKSRINRALKSPSLYSGVEGWAVASLVFAHTQQAESSNSASHSWLLWFSSVAGAVPGLFILFSQPSGLFWFQRVKVGNVHQQSPERTGEPRIIPTALSVKIISNLSAACTSQELLISGSC